MSHPALERARELRAEDMIRHEADIVRTILSRHGVVVDDDVVFDIVGYTTGMLRCDGSRRGRKTA